MKRENIDNLLFRRKKMQALVVASLLTALSIILTRFFSVMILGGTVRLGLGLVPIEVAGFLLGPFWGAMTGLLSDLLGIAINPMGTPHLGITLDTVLAGLIPGLLRLLFSKGLTIRLFVINQALVALIPMWFMRTLWLSQLKGIAYVELLWIRLPSVLINAMAIFILLALMLKMLRYMEKQFHKGRESARPLP